MDLLKRLIEDYGYDTPILIDEINYEGISRKALLMRLKRLMEADEIQRYQRGIYYIPTESILGKRNLSSRSVIEKLYIKNNGKTFGFYSGYKLLNSLRLTTQVPNKFIIFTNKTSTARQTVVGRTVVMLRKPVFEIDDANLPLQILLELVQYEQFMSLTLEEKKEVLQVIGVNESNIRLLAEMAKTLPNKLNAKLIESEVIYAAASL